MPGKSPNITDQIPYHCSKCGDSKGFSNLQLLRQHLEVEHSYNSPLIRNYDIYGNRYRNRTQSVPMVPVTPLMANYSKEAKELERQLTLAKEAELRHKQQWEKVKYTFDQPYILKGSADINQSGNNGPKQATGNSIKAESFGPDSDMFQPSTLHVEDFGYPSCQQSMFLPENKENRYTPNSVGFDHLKMPENNSTVKNLWTHTNKDVLDLSHLVDRLKEQLQFKDTQMKKASEELKKLTEDRRNLQRQVLDSSKEHENYSSRLSYMEGQIEEKDKLILHKQNDVTSMSGFLHDLSIKETAARQRLEDYVNVLLDRTERAESKLRKKTERDLSRPQSFRETDAIPYDHDVESDLRRDWHVLSATIDHSTPRDLSNETYIQYPQQSGSIPGPWTSTPHHKAKPPTQLTDTTGNLPSFISPPLTAVQQQAYVNALQEQDTANGATHRHSSTKRQLPIPSHVQIGSGISPSGFSNCSVGEVIDMHKARTKTHSPQLSGLVENSRKAISTDDRTTPKSFTDSAVGTIDSSVPNADAYEVRNRSSSVLSSSNKMPASGKLPPKMHYQNVPVAQNFGQSSHGFLPTNQAIMKESTFASYVQPQLPDKDDAKALQQQREWLTKQLKSIELQEQRLLNKSGDSHGLNVVQESEEEDSDSFTETESDFEYDRAPSALSGHNEKSNACSIGEVHLTRESTKRHKPATAINRNQTNPVIKRRRDALYCIFLYLDTKSLSKVSGVCKEWLHISREPSLWRNVVLSNTRISSKYLCTISSWCTELQILHLSGLRPRAMKLKENRQYYEKSIRGCLEAGLEQLLRVAGNTLTSLKIVDCGEIVTDRCLWLASCHCPNVERVAYVSETDPAGAEVIYSLGAGCRNITTLIVHPQFPNYKPHKFNNKTVQKIAQSWPDLRVLCVGGVDVNGKGLSLIGIHCQGLEVLELDHMCEINEETAIAMCEGGLKKLDALEFKFTPVTPKAIVYFKNACPNLKVISICIGISDYFEDTMNPLHRENYQEIVNKLKSLRKRPELKGVLHIRSDYG